MVLHLDFSVVVPTGSLADIEKSFDHSCNTALNGLLIRYKKILGDGIPFDFGTSAAGNLESLTNCIEAKAFPPLYIIIDEYDNFSNQLITSHKDHLYRELTADNSFLKTFFKTMKAGRGYGTIANIFITGVLPITIDDLASGFNIATFITLEPHFEAMLGFTQRELDALLNDIYRDYELPPETRDEVGELMRRQYNGYHFVKSKGEALYNSTLVTYFLRYLTEYGEIPKRLTDLNLRTDISWVRRITSAYEGSTEEFVDQLTLENRILYDESALVTKFSMSQFFEKGFFPISFFYLGMLTRLDEFHLHIPNLNMQQIFVEYFNELHHIDVSSTCGEMMSRFIRDLDVEALFHDYWRLYIAQFPEAILKRSTKTFTARPSWNCAAAICRAGSPGTSSAAIRKDAAIWNSPASITKLLQKLAS